MSPLQDQVAIVTGAGRGIGESIARRLVEEGAPQELLMKKEGYFKKLVSLQSMKLLS